jgi:hypothetical protein
MKLESKLYHVMKLKNNRNSRRSFLTNVATLSAGITLGGTKLWGAPAYLPNLRESKSSFNGIQLGLITYSFRALKDQSAEATLQYILDCDASSIELMGSTAEAFIGRPENKINRRLFSRLSRKERNNSLSTEEKKELDQLKKEK